MFKEQEAEGKEIAKRLGANFIPAEGPLNARIILVGEAGGEEEDRQGRPFVGRSGQLLRALLKKAGFKPEDVYITNVVKIRPTTLNKSNNQY